MSKKGVEDSHYEQAENMGRKNKSLISSVAGWCQHIDVKGRRASMFGEMLDIPMSTSIGCPHADGGYEAANLEWIARDFIIGNCLNCEKHRPVTANNFGVGVVADYYENKRREQEEEKARHDRLTVLRQEAERLINKEKTTAEIKKLSIIKLVEKLDSPEDCKDTAKQLFESARLSPEFFSEAAINYISLFIEKEGFGNILMETICELQVAKHKLSPFVSQNILGALKNHAFPDLAASIWGNGLENSQLATSTDIFTEIIQNCNYENFYHFGKDKSGSYPRTIKLLGRLHSADADCFNDLFNSRLMNTDKSVRVNTNGLLQDLIEARTGDFIVFLPQLVRSFDFIDNDHGGESGDYQTVQTILKLYVSEPEKVMEVCLSEGNKLSEWGQAELLDVYEKIVLEDWLYEVNREMSVQAVTRINFFLLNDSKKNKLVESALETLGQVASSRPELLAPYFDTYIGFLIQVNEQRQSFEWYRQDASNVLKPSATFNPLVGKHFLEIENMATELANTFRRAGEIITKLVKEDSEEYLSGLLQVVEKINSKAEGKFKAELIGLVQKSTKDIISVGNILPQIYGYLHDTDSEDVRFAGMKFVVHLAQRYPQLITSTLIELIKVFFDDKVVGVRGLAIDAYGYIIKQFPEHVEKKCFDHIYKMISDNYVYVHKAAISFAYSAYPFLSKSERRLWTIDLYRYADFYYKNADFSYGLEVAKKVLYFAADDPIVHKNVIESLVVKFCKCKDYYVEKDALSYLTHLVKSNRVYVDIWVEEAIGFMGRTMPSGRYQSNDDRNEVMEFFNELNESDIAKHTAMIVNHVKSSIDTLRVPIIPDVIHFHGVFARFNLWKPIKQLSEYFKSKIPEISKFNSVHKFNQRSLRIAETEIKVGSSTIDLRCIQTLLDARP